MSARPGLCGGHRATGVPTAIANHDDEFGLRFTNEKIQEKARPQPGLKIFILFNTDYCVLTQPDFAFDHSY
jgi:hypothetical protein